MLKFIKSITKRKIFIGVTAIVISLALIFSGFEIHEKISPQLNSNLQVGIGEKVITIGDIAYAAGTADYTCDGVDDDVQFQAALNALPANGGKISVLTGNYVFSANVTRAINNVTVEGNGLSSNFTRDGVNAIFVAGGNNWTFRDILLDAGGISLGSTTGWTYENVQIGTVYYANSGTFSASGTPDYVVGVNTSTDDVPGSTGYWVKSGSTGQVIETNTNALTSLQWALNTAAAIGTHQVVQFRGDFSTTGQLNAVSNVDVIGKAIITMTSNANGQTIYFNNTTNTTWSDITAVREGDAGVTAYFYPLMSPWHIEGNNTDRSTVLRNCNGINNVFVNNALAEGSMAGLWIGYQTTASPTIEGGIYRASLNANGYDNTGILVQGIYDPSTGIIGSPYLKGVIGIAGGGVGLFVHGAGIFLTEPQSTILEDSIGYGITGIMVNHGTPTIKNCRGVVDRANTGGYTYGVRASDAGAAIIIGTEGISGQLDSASLYISDDAAPVVSGFWGHPPMQTLEWSYDDINDGRFQPYASPGYYVYSITVWRTSAQAQTLDIGTSIGGHEIAQAISLNGLGTANFAMLSNPVINAGGYLYATPSGAVPDGSFYVLVEAMERCVNYWGALYLNTYGAARISYSTFFGVNSATDPVILRIGANSVTSTAWEINQCEFRSFQPGGYPIEAANPLSNAPIYNSRLSGGTIVNITSLAQGSNSISNSGTATILNGTTSIAVTHGLAITPTVGKISIIYTENATNAVGQWWITSANATAFTVNVANDPGASNLDLAWSYAE